MDVYLGADHGGYALKNTLSSYFEGRGYKAIDCGCRGTEPSDYPVYASEVVRKVLANPDSVGVLICRSGQGMAIAANRWPTIRAALAWDASVAAESRRDNDANLLVLPADYVDENQALAVVAAFFATPFSHNERHLRRIEQLGKLPTNVYAH